MRASQFKNLLADLQSLSPEQLSDLRAEADRLHQRTHALSSLDAAMVGVGCPHCNSFKYTKNGLGRGGPALSLQGLLADLQRRDKHAAVPPSL